MQTQRMQACFKRVTYPLIYQSMACDKRERFKLRGDRNHREMGFNALAAVLIRLIING